MTLLYHLIYCVGSLFCFVTDITNPSKAFGEDKKWYQLLPCFRQEEKSEDSESQEVTYYEDHQTRLKYLSQTKFWRWFMDFQAVIVCAVCVFLYAFFH